MKNEDIYDGITEIEDDLIDAAATRKKRPRWQMWGLAAAAAVAVCIGAALLWPSGGDTISQPTPPSPSQPTEPTAAVPVEPTVEPVEPTDPITSVNPPSGSEEEPYTPPVLELPTPTGPYAVSLAAYPEQPKLTDSEDSYAPWSQAREERRKASSSYDGGNGFFVDSMTRFLADSQGENRVVSPLNLYMALAMLAETADGNSRAQLLDALDAESIEQLRDNIARLWNGTYQDDGQAVTVLANSLWMNQDLDYSQKTTDTLARNYYASSYQGKMGDPAYTQALRDWLNEQTGGLLEEAVNGVELTPETVLALVSTIYYKAQWDSKFSPESTAPGTFHATAGDVTCDFMHGEGTGWVYHGDGFTALGKGIANGTMWFLLPKEGMEVDTVLDPGKLAAFLDTVQSEDWFEGQPDLSWAWTRLTLPKFDVTSDLELGDQLAALGVTDVFDPAAADFSPLLEDQAGVSVSKVRHAARVTIDEDGCKAAAFTMLVSGMGGPSEEIDFVVDRPFVFVLTGESELPLFAGVVNTP